MSLREPQFSDVLSINSDNVITSHYVDEGKYTELMTFIGIEKPRATPGKERDSNEEKTQTESTSATLSATSTAAANGGQNAETEGEYRLTKAANTVILKYGRNRIAWVLSVVIKNAAADVFTKENVEWANEAVNNFGFPEEPPTFEIKTNPVLLNIFIQRFREVQCNRQTAARIDCAKSEKF